MGRNDPEMARTWYYIFQIANAQQTQRLSSPPTKTPEATPSDQEKEIPEMQNSQATKPLVWWEEIPAEARGLTFNSPSSR
jgi:hypothetical protein